MADFFWFSDAQWERIAPLLPTDVRGKARVDDRRVLSGIVHALRCGGRWADCANVYGPKKTLYNRFVRWAERGVWEGIFSALAGADGAAFLPVLETHPLAYEIGCWVLDKSCQTLAAWRSQGLPPLRMSVNLFAAQLRSGTLIDVVEAALARHGLVPGDLELEITETIALRHDGEELAPLRSLRERGVGIAFDDFGTGFASLSALKDFPLTRLKIDQSFVRDVCSNRHSTAIVRGVITIGRSLGLDVIAEGIETNEQIACLREWRCASGQGYFYGRPVSASDFARNLLIGSLIPETRIAR